MEQQSKRTGVAFEEAVRKIIVAIAGSGLVFVGATELMSARVFPSGADFSLALSLIMYSASETQSNEVGSICFLVVSFLFKALIDTAYSPGTILIDIVGAAIASGFIASTMNQSGKRKRG